MKAFAVHFLCLPFTCSTLGNCPSGLKIQFKCHLCVSKSFTSYFYCTNKYFGTSSPVTWVLQEFLNGLPISFCSQIPTHPSGCLAVIFLKQESDAAAPLLKIPQQYSNAKRHKTNLLYMEKAFCNLDPTQCFHLIYCSCYAQQQPSNVLPFRCAAAHAILYLKCPVLFCPPIDSPSRAMSTITMYTN